MNYYDAHTLLNRVKDGHLAPVHLINKALELTGDYDGETWLYPWCAGTRSEGATEGGNASGVSQGGNPNED